MNIECPLNGEVGGELNFLKSVKNITEIFYLLLEVPQDICTR